MNLKVTLSEKRKVVIESLEFSSDDGSVVLGLWWVDTHFTPGKVEGKDVTIYNDERCERVGLHEVKGLFLTSLQACDISTKEAIDWLDIESIQISDGDEVYDVPSCFLRRFKRHNLYTDCLHLSLTEEQYQTIAQYVRLHDKTDNLDGALSNCLDSDSGYDNIYSYLKKELASDPQKMTDAFNVGDYTGEEEAAAVNHIISTYGGMAVYTLISNAGTPDECFSDVILMRRQADILSENIRERNNGGTFPFAEGEISLTDKDGDTVDLFYVDEIRLKTVLDEF